MKTCASCKSPAKCKAAGKCMATMKKTGGDLKMVEKDGKKVPFYAADGKGKMKYGGKVKKMKYGGKAKKMKDGGKCMVDGIATRGRTKITR